MLGGQSYTLLGVFLVFKLWSIEERYSTLLGKSSKRYIPLLSMSLKLCPLSVNQLVSQSGR